MGGAAWRPQCPTGAAQQTPNCRTRNGIGGSGPCPGPTFAGLHPGVQNTRVGFPNPQQRKGSDIMSNFSTSTAGWARRACTPVLAGAAALTVGAIAFAPSAGAAGLSPLVKPAAGSSSSAYLGGYQATPSGGLASASTTFTMPKLTCTTAQDNDGRGDPHRRLHRQPRPVRVRHWAVHSRGARRTRSASPRRMEDSSSRAPSRPGTSSSPRCSSRGRTPRPRFTT